KETIEGVWVGTAKEAGKKVALEVRMEFKGKKVTISLKGEAALTGTYKIAPDKSPATMDITIQGTTILAIYELKGDQLKICNSTTEGGARPSAIEATEKTALATLKRQKSAVGVGTDAPGREKSVKADRLAKEAAGQFFAGFKAKDLNVLMKVVDVPF